MFKKANILFIISLIIVLLTRPQMLCAQYLTLPEEGHSITSLNGSWNTIIDPYETGYYDYRYQPRNDGYFLNRQQHSKSELVEYNFEHSDNLHVPGDWNTQRGELLFYEGTIWYQRMFDYTPKRGSRLFIWVGAANYEAISWLNGKKLGQHTGGFTPFWFEITDIVKEHNNNLVFKVDNKRHRDGVPTLNTDWWNYGGLTRDVLLVEVPETFITDYKIQLDPDHPDYITGWVQLDGARNASARVSLSIQGAGLKTDFTTDEDGKGVFRLPAPEIKRWSPQNPKLYDVQFIISSDTVRDEVGFRTIKVSGENILLNGKPIFMRGISIHEVSPIGFGRAYRPADADVLLGWAKDLGCNFVRLAHYPHNRYMTRKADEKGILVWSEIPVYWTIQWKNPQTYKLAEQQLQEMIERDKNRASVIIWSVANETPRKDARLTFLTNLIDEAHRLDPSRLVTAATELEYKGDSLVINDPLAEHLDVIGANEYLGWYGGTPQEIPDHTWVNTFKKPLILSEFGGGALYGKHGDATTRWTEEYQSAVYKNQLKMLDKITSLKGMSPWILNDFRSPRRPLPNIQDFYNRKGLISEHGLRKQAFYILQDYYQHKSAKK